MTSSSRARRRKARDRYLRDALAIAIETADEARRAGLRLPIITMLSDTPWSRDDHEWFAHNPTRSHRIRPVFPGEAQGSAWPTESPVGYELFAAIRQIEPGTIFRASFFRSVAAPETS